MPARPRPVSRRTASPTSQHVSRRFARKAGVKKRGRVHSISTAGQRAFFVPARGRDARSQRDRVYLMPLRRCVKSGVRIRSTHVPALPGWPVAPGAGRSDLECGCRNELDTLQTEAEPLPALDPGPRGTLPGMDNPSHPSDAVGARPDRVQPGSCRVRVRPLSSRRGGSRQDDGGHPST